MSIEAMKQWLEALEHMCNHTRAKVGYKAKIVGGAMDSLRQAIAEAEKQKPVAWRWGVPKLKNGKFEWRYSINKTREDAIPLYTKEQL